MSEILGLTGLQCSGKDTVASLLANEFNFESVTSSDVVRDYIQANDLGEPTRPLCRKVANELRDADPAAIMKEVLSTTDASERVVVSGIYAVEEAVYLAENGARIVECYADALVRYARALDRGRIGDHVDFETFQQWEAIEADSQEQSVSQISKLAIARVVNNEGLAELTREVSTLAEKLGISYV